MGWFDTLLNRLFPSEEKDDYEEQFGSMPPDDGSPKTSNVYVVELRRDALIDSIFEGQTAHRAEHNGECFYVGMTGLTPEERFRNHVRGIRASRIVKKYGRRLRPELYEHLNPMTRKQAEYMEPKLAHDLRQQGHAVHQN